MLSKVKAGYEHATMGPQQTASPSAGSVGMRMHLMHLWLMNAARVHVALVLLTAACAAAGPVSSGPGTGDAPQGAEPPQQDPIWAEMAEAARREGKLVLAGNPSPEVRERIPEAFRERFGVEIEYLVARGSELQARLESERAAGLYTIDVMISGTPSEYRMHQQGLLAPIRPLLVAPDALELSVWRNNRLPFVDPDQQYMFQLQSGVGGAVYINPQAVNESEIRSWDDLLDPKWRGKISHEDPTVTGQGQGNGVYVYLWKGEEFFRRLYVDQQPVFSRDDRQMVDWLVRGVYPISTGLNPDDIGPVVREGLPARSLGLLDGQGWLASGGTTMVLLRNAPHPNAAKLFINWVASRAGSQLYAELEEDIPMRKDIDTPWTAAWPWQVPREAVKYIDADDSVHQTQVVPGVVARMREILGR